MKEFRKEELEILLRIYAQAKDYTSIMDILKDHHDKIDINTKDRVTNKTALDILLEGENSLERNETIISLVDEYGAQGLSEIKRKELLQEIEESEERFFDLDESLDDISIGSSSSLIRTEDGRGSPDAVDKLFKDELSPDKNKHEKTKKSVSRTLSQEAKEFQFNSAKAASSAVSLEVDKQEDPVVEEKHKTKEIERVDLTGYEDFTLKHIVENDLIAKAALQSDLTIASAMVKRVVDSDTPGSETAIKNGLSEMITAFPRVHSQADEPRNAAYIVYNDLKKQYHSINDMTMKSPEIIAITSKPGFQKSRKRLPSIALAEDLKQAQEGLRSELPPKIEEASLDYQTEKDKVTAVTQNFRETVDLVTDRINLNDYQTPKLDHYSAELKDIVVNAMTKNKQKFAASKSAEKSKPKTTKTISDLNAKKSLVKPLPHLSEEAQAVVTDYHAKYSKEKVTQLEMISLAARDRIMVEVANKNKFDVVKFKEEFYELMDDPKYSKACDEVFKLHQASQESKNLVKLYQSKKEETQDVIDEIKADLVPIAIRLHQFNEQLDPEDRLDPKNLHAYINAAFSAQLKEHMPEEKLDPSLKNQLSQTIDNPDNKKAYEYSEEELQGIADPKEEMKGLLGQVGLKPRILEKAPVMSEEEKAIAEAGKSMKGIGMSFAGSDRPKIDIAIGGVRPKMPSIRQK